MNRKSANMCMTKLLQLMTKIKIYALQKKKKSHLLLDLLQLKLNEPSIVETDGKLKICLGCNSLGSWLLLFSVVINAYGISKCGYYLFTILRKKS